LGRMSAGAYYAHMTAIQLVRTVIHLCGNFSLDWVRDVVVFGGAAILSFGLIKVFSLIPGVRFMAAFDAFINKKPPPRAAANP